MFWALQNFETTSIFQLTGICSGLSISLLPELLAVGQNTCSSWGTRGKLFFEDVHRVRRRYISAPSVVCVTKNLTQCHFWSLKVEGRLRDWCIRCLLYSCCLTVSFNNTKIVQCWYLYLRHRLLQNGLVFLALILQTILTWNNTRMVFTKLRYQNIIPRSKLEILAKDVTIVFWLHHIV